MPPKSRHHNRDSQSFLSHDLLRGIVQDRSHTVIETSAFNSDFRSASTFSRDPNSQYQTSKSRTGSLPRGRLLFPDVSALGSYHNVKPDIQMTISSTASDGVSRYKRRRRLPWFSLPWHSESNDDNKIAPMGLPQIDSMSSVSKSSISSPMLTSTTNTRVANAENVYCSEVFFSVPSPVFDARSESSEEAGEHKVYHDVDNTSSWTSPMRSIKTKLGHSRRASAGLMLTSSWSRTGWQPAGSESMASRREGKMAVYKGKLQHLGQRLHVLPIDLSRPGSAVIRGPGLELVKAKEIESHHFNKALDASTPRATSILPGLHSDSTTDLLRGSLSRSFASVIDKFELRSSPTLVHYSPSMNTLKKAKSMFGLYDKYGEHGNTSSTSKNESTKDVMPDIKSLTRYENKSRRFDSPKLVSTTTPLSATKTETDEQSKAPGVTGRNNHPDSLRSHPNVTIFTSPSGQTQEVTRLNPRTPCRIEHATCVNENENVNDDDDGSDTLQEGFLHSTSTGQMTHYQRTESPVVKSLDPEVPKARVQETPTKQPTFKKLKKSVSGFFARSASRIKLPVSTPTKRTRIEEEDEGEDGDSASRDGQKRATHGRHPYGPSRLHNADISRVHLPDTLHQVNRDLVGGSRYNRVRSTAEEEIDREKRRGRFFGEEYNIDYTKNPEK